ncbi:MAG: amino acid ABC transporter permease [Devosia sp.]
MSVALNQPPPRTVGPQGIAGAARWVWHTFFGTITNSLLTVIVLWLAIVVVTKFINWAFIEATVQPATLRDCIDGGGACWAFIQDKWRLILFGTYPFQEQWRPALALTLLAGLIVGTAMPAIWRSQMRRRWLFGTWLVGLGLITVLMAGGLGFSTVEVRFWSGLPLTVMLAFVGMIACFVLAVLLALGRRSEMVVVRWFSIAYIELIRGVPLISLLFMANIMLPLLLPQGFTVHNLIRAQIAFIVFFSAYMAETIRGGLQAIPKGQYKAAMALGMGYWQTMFYVILPQALKIVIPSLVNLFIAGFKDTSLVIVISMLDLLGTANAAKADPEWLGLFVEAYFFIACIYLFVCATISWYSRWLERHIAARAAPLARVDGVGA